MDSAAVFLLALALAPGMVATAAGCANAASKGKEVSAAGHTPPKATPEWDRSNAARTEVSAAVLAAGFLLAAAAPPGTACSAPFPGSSVRTEHSIASD